MKISAVDVLVKNGWKRRPSNDDNRGEVWQAPYRSLKRLWLLEADALYLLEHEPTLTDAGWDISRPQGVWTCTHPVLANEYDLFQAVEVQRVAKLRRPMEER